MSYNFHKQLADETRRVLKDNGWTLRQAERNTGIGYTTILRMSEGRSANVESITAWARAIDEDELKWLRYAGYDILPGVEDTPALLEKMAEELEAVPEGLREVIPLYEGLNSVEQKLAARTIRAMLEAIAAGREGDVGLEGEGDG
jgi:transcriptional regulator with XRE-family HTH domain